MYKRQHQADGDEPVDAVVRQGLVAVASAAKDDGRLHVEIFLQERPDAFASLLGGVKPRRAQHEPQRTLHVVRRIVLGERLQFREASERAFGLLIELGAESGQLHAPAFAYEQLRTELPLEIGYGLRYGLHGHVLLFGSGRKAIVLSCRHEVFYLLDVHVTRSFEAHQRTKLYCASVAFSGSETCFNYLLTHMCTSRVIRLNHRLNLERKGARCV